MRLCVHCALRFAPLWFVEYPDATSYACPGLREKKPEVGWQRSLESFLDGRDGVAAKAPPAEWGGAIDLCWIRDQVPLSGLVGGVPFFNEIVFCHRPSRTLIVTDLWWNYPASKADVQGGAADVPFSSRLWKIGMDRVYRPVYNNLMRTPTCAASYETILSWDFDYIAPAHGEPMCGDAKRVLRQHLSL